MQPTFDAIWDPSARKHGGSPESQAAFARAAPTLSQARALVLEIVRRAGAGGATSKEIAARMGKGLNAISGRCTELVEGGLIRKNGLRRDGAAVLVENCRI